MEGRVITAQNKAYQLSSNFNLCDFIRKSNTIREQMMKMNTLTEWDYEYFTMDEVKCFFLLK
jgi:hypothetical protein